ncbi:uncharacterized protein LOC143464982 [Clavelina lepadiformis]|uniref:uncharacterized protein LOC143464982 n=1 Tax=Clavelina lepadiformis TaxID=159417 RepID=UPI004041AD0A
MSIQVCMTGGSPWGFKMTGGKDFHQPLAIGKVTSGGKASRSGVVEGYLIEKVNGEEFSNLTHHEAQNKIKSAGFTLTLMLSKPKPRGVPTQPTTTTSSNNATSKSTTSQSNLPPPKYYQKKEPVTYQNGNAAPVQSPAYYAKTQQYKAPIRDEETQKITLTSDIKEMIEEDENDSKQQQQSGARRASAVKTWQDPTQTATNNLVSTSNDAGQNQNKTQAAVNIGKFFQGSSAPRYGPPAFAKELADVSAPAGEPCVLEIRLASNLPVPTVHWYHNNKPARESKDKDIRFLSNGPVHTLVLGELSHELLGTYVCTIMNKNGSTSCRCTVSINNEGPQSTPASPSYVPHSPQPSMTASTQRVIPSTSLGLYSNKNAQESYQGQVNRKLSRESSEESEVMKALREDTPSLKNTPQTRTMKYLEESLLPESEDL